MGTQVNCDTVWHLSGIIRRFRSLLSSPFLKAPKDQRMEVTLNLLLLLNSQLTSTHEWKWTIPVTCGTFLNFKM